MEIIIELTMAVKKKKHKWKQNKWWSVLAKGL